MTCLVVGNHTQGLSIIRSLGRAGIRSHILYDKKICLSRFSRHAASFTFSGKHMISRAFDQGHHDALLRQMLDMVPDGEKWVLFGVNEDVIAMFYKHQDVLREKFLFPHTEISKIIDKYVFAGMTSGVGVSTPGTYLLSEADDVFVEGRNYVAKGRTGNKFRSLGNLKGKVFDSHDGIEAVRKYISGKLSEDEVIIQEVIASGADDRVSSFCGFSVDGKLYAEFQYRNVRQSPDQYGTGTYAMSIWDESLAKEGRKIVKELKYTGVFEIEFLKNSVDGRYTVIEMNPRAWKSVGLATASNRNLVHYYFRFLQGESLEDSPGEYLEGKRWAHVATDLVFMLRNRRLDFGYKDMVFCDYDREDIKPFLAEIFLAPLIAAGI